MEDFRIIINSTADLPKEYIEEYNLGVINLACLFEGITYGKEQELDVVMFYEHMRSGSMPTTSQVNPIEAKNEMEEFLKDIKNLLVIGFSSGLSGSYNNMQMAAQEVLEENPTCKIIVIDSKCASLGEGLLIHKAVELKKQGKTIEEVATWVEENKQKIVHMFTVDDLNHLYRGGRISKAAAIVGTMISLKPIIHVDEEGKLVQVAKVRGRKKSLHSLVDYMEEKMGIYKECNDIVFISHGDAEEEAKLVAQEVNTRFGIDSFLVNHIGPVIGAHAGPGIIALFFMGEER